MTTCIRQRVFYKAGSLLPIAAGLWVVLLLSAYSCEAASSGISDPPRAQASALISNLRSALLDGNEREVVRARESLKSLGEAGALEINARLPEASPRESTELIIALCGIGGDTSTGILLDRATRTTNASGRLAALNALANRPIRTEPAPETVESLSVLVRASDGRVAASAAGILASCERVDRDTRTDPILLRFLQEMRSLPEPLVEENRKFGTLFSDPVFVLNGFLRALHKLSGPELRARLQAEYGGTGPEDRERTWLTIALGYAGASDVSSALAGIVDSEQPVSVRAVALQAYSYCEGMAAAPFLESYLADKTVGPSRGGSTRYPLAFVARNELGRLRRLQE